MKMDEKHFSLLQQEIINSLNNTTRDVNDTFDIFEKTNVVKELREEFNDLMNNTKNSLLLRFNRIKRFYNGEYQKEVVKKYQWLIDIIKSHYPTLDILIGKVLIFNTINFFISTDELSAIEKELGVNTNLTILNHLGTNNVTVTCTFTKLPANTE